MLTLLGVWIANLFAVKREEHEREFRREQAKTERTSALIETCLDKVQDAAMELLRLVTEHYAISLQGEFPLNELIRISPQIRATRARLVGLAVDEPMLHEAIEKLTISSFKDHDFHVQVAQLNKLQTEVTNIIRVCEQLKRIAPTGLANSMTSIGNSRNKKKMRIALTLFESKVSILW